MSYRCVVVDDEKPARERIKRLIDAEAAFEVVGESADATSAIALIDELRPDLVFLDVQMPAGSGFDVIEQVRVVPAVIFTTAYDQYAVRAFDVQSIDYLLKPFSKRRFAEALERAGRALGKAAGDSAGIVVKLEEIRRELTQPQHPPGGPPQRISARRGSRIVLLPPGEVLWFETEETLVFAHTQAGRLLVDRTLSDLERQLEPAFFRSHRRFLVNLARISEIQPGDAGSYAIVFSDDDHSRVPLSRRQARKLRERIPW